jgi:hypothetical protein
MREHKMTDISDFAKVSGIDGVKSYYLVKYNGSIVSYKGDSADTICPCIAFSGLNCDAISSTLGFSKFNHMTLSRQCQENMIIFSLGNHFLAVIKQANASAPDLIRRVSEFIKNLGNIDGQSN